MSQAERNGGNPLKISKVAIETTFRLLTGDPDRDLSRFRGDLSAAPFADILYPAFDILRMGSLGWNIAISKEERSRLGGSLEDITSMGPEDGEGKFDVSYDYLTAVELMRAVVATAFVEQAKTEGKPMPDINGKIVDAVPVRREWLGLVRSNREGMTALVTEDLDAQMREENPRLYEETMGLKDRLTERFAARTVLLYSGQPKELIELHTPTIRKRWEESIREMALRTYAWFAPNGPTNLVLIPVEK